MDLAELSRVAIDRAVELSKGKKVKTNVETDNDSGKLIPSYLLERKLVEGNNIDRVLVQSGCYTKDQVYGDKT